MAKLKVLFLCTGNSCRSQMAEGWARRLKGDVIEPYSAGVEKHGLNPRAVQVMAEAGVDISSHHSKTLHELAGVTFDVVVTVCASAHERCPIFPGRGRVVHVGFDDPPALARQAATEEEALSHYRRVRDEIRAFIQTLPEGLDRPRMPEGLDRPRMPEGLDRPRMPEGLDRPRMPEGLDRPRMPEGLDRPRMPEGLDRPRK